MGALLALESLSISQIKMHSAYFQAWGPTAAFSASKLAFKNLFHIFILFRWSSHNIKLVTLKWTNSVTFSRFTVFCSHHFHPVTRHFSHSRSKPILIKQSLAIFTAPQILASLSVCVLSLWIYLLWLFQVNGFIQYMNFCICLYLVCWFQLICIVTCISALFLLWLDNIPFYDYITFCLSIQWLTKFGLLTIVNSAAINTWVYAFARVPVFYSFTYILRSYGNFMLTFWETIKLLHRQQCMKIPVSPHHCKNFFFFFLK